jgi:glycosyltransferase involved in cell wall biosynthesis
MKYPFVLFFRLDKYSEIDAQMKDSDLLNCSVNIINNSTELNKLFDSNYQILVTYGPNETEYHNLVCPFIANRMSNRWIHFKEIESIDSFNRAVNYCFIHNCTFSREQIRPIFSIFTTCYNSYEKILRAYKSLKNQTLSDWEWVVLDDSPDDKHFNYLIENLNDERIRLYKRSKNSGNIGNVKNEAVSLCRGKYVLELDHDDEILPYVLSDSENYFEKNSDVGFIYMDFTNIYENGKNFWYGDFICKGYGSYYCQKYNDRWVYIYNTPNINNITLSHLVCCPNHPRIWRRDILIKAGNYSELLPVCDDYEILLRTARITRMAKICKLGYIQYMNENNNNFSLIRNSEINRIGPQFIMPIFYDKFKMNDIMREQNAYEDEKYIYDHSKIWLRDQNSYKHHHSNFLFNPDYEKQYCIIGIDNLISKLESIRVLYSNIKNDFLVLDNCPIEDIWDILDKYKFDRMKCYSLKEHNVEKMINYFKLMYKSRDDYEFIINDEDKNKLIDINVNEYLNYNVKYKMLMGYQNDYPFPFIVIDNFLKNDKVNEINNCVKKLKIEDSTYKYYDETWEKNKYAFERNFDPKLEKLFKYLNSDDFIFYLEKI